MLPEPDYKKCSYDELVDVYEHIDKEKYPERFKMVALLLGKNTDGGADFSGENPFEWPASKLKEIEDTPELAEMKKMKRIEEFFDSLSESGAEYYSDSFSGSGDFGGDNGGGD